MKRCSIGIETVFTGDKWLYKVSALLYVKFKHKVSIGGNNNIRSVVYLEGVEGWSSTLTYAIVTQYYFFNDVITIDFSFLICLGTNNFQKWSEINFV